MFLKAEGQRRSLHGWLLVVLYNDFGIVAVLPQFLPQRLLNMVFPTLFQVGD